MELLLLITIVIVAIAIMNFKDYLKNPYKRPKINSQDDQALNYNNPYQNKIKSNDSVKESIRELSREEKIRNSEYGIIVGLLSKLANSDGKVCELELELMENTINDIAEAMLLQSSMYPKEEILGILHNIFVNTPQSVEELSLHYATFTKGQYKSRLKLVEYLLSLAYADEELDENEREIILDVAAFLEIDNADFNAMYDEYEKFYQNKKENLVQNLQDAYALLGVSKEDSIEDIKRSYKKLVRENHPDILNHKGLDASIMHTYTQKLQAINAAFALVKKDKEA